MTTSASRPPLALRPFRASDRAAIVALYDKARGPDYMGFTDITAGWADGVRQPKPDVPERMGRALDKHAESPNVLLLVAEVPAGGPGGGGAPELAGFLTAYVADEGQDDGGGGERLLHCWIDDVVVDESRRGEGIGEALMERALAWGAERGARHALLESNVANARAHKLFERLGYEAVSKVFVKRIEVESENSPGE